MIIWDEAGKTAWMRPCASGSRSSDLENPASSQLANCLAIARYHLVSGQQAQLFKPSLGD